MRFKLTIVSAISTGVVLAIVAAVFLLNGHTATAQAPGGPGHYFWSYATKFVCGTEQPNPAGTVGEPPVKPGNYATDINIHNPNYRDGVLFKKMIILVGDNDSPTGPFVNREPAVTAPGKFAHIVLPPDWATMDDCVALTNLAKQTGLAGASGSFMIGYLVVLSSVDIDIDAVYTAEVYSGVNATNVAIPAGIAEDLLHVTGKRVFVPGNAGLDAAIANANNADNANNGNNGN